MIYGGKRYPGGAPAWVPSLVLLLGECKAESKSRAVASMPAGVSAVPHGPSPSNRPSLSLLQLMETKYSRSLATDLHRILLAYDAYSDWRWTMDLATLDDADKERVALKAAQKAVTLMGIFNDLSDSNGKTKMFHVIVYIVPRFIR
eukprot:429527-Pleurochrysis_carterae.AAC.1